MPPILPMGDGLTRNNSKNLRLQMGRCPVRSIFPEALEALARNQDKFRYGELVGRLREDAC